MYNLIKKAFTEIDNETWDLSKILAAITIITAIGLTVYTVVWKEAVFDPNNFGMGLSALFAATAALLKFKKESDTKE